MQFSALAVLLAAAVLPGFVAAQTQHTIMVGMNGTKTYTPSNITAAVGDTVTFVFMAGNHTVTQSTFAAPCVEAFNATTDQSGFDTSFQFVNASTGMMPSVTLQVTSAAPIWFYCRQAGHCGAGMVGAINANASSTKSYQAFKASAIAINGTGAATPSGSAAPLATPLGTGSTPQLLSSGSMPSSTATGSAAAASQTKNAAMGDKAKGAGALLAAVGVAAAVLL